MNRIIAFYFILCRFILFCFPNILVLNDIVERKSNYFYCVLRNLIKISSLHSFQLFQLEWINGNILTILSTFIN